MLCNLSRRISKQSLFFSPLKNTLSTGHRTIFTASSVQFAKKKGGVSDEEMSKILSSVNSKGVKQSSKEQEELDELQALLEDEEILTKQEKKPAPKQTTTTNTNTRNKPLGTIIDEDADIDDVEMDKMLKELGLSGRWDQYKNMINSFDNAPYNGMNEQLIEDEGDMNYEDKNAYKLFGKNYMSSLKSEFDSPEIFNFIKNQVDTKGSPSGAASDFATVAAATAVNSASKKMETPTQQSKPANAKPVTPQTSKPSTSSKKQPTDKLSMSMDEIANMDLNISADDIMKDFQNPAMKKMMKEVLGVDSDDQLKKFETDLQASLGQGKNLKDMEAELEKEMKELESLFGFAKDLAGKKKPSKK